MSQHEQAAGNGTGISGVGLRGVGREAWSALALHSSGKMRMLSATLPFCGDVDEVVQRLADRIRTDADFANEYAEGWTFYPLRIDRGIRARRLALQ